MICPVCNKTFHPQRLDLYVYKRGNATLCSYHCMRYIDKLIEGETPMKGNRITLEQKKKAVQIALDGGNQLLYLNSLGSKNAPSMWGTIKRNLKETDPETYEKLQAVQNGRIRAAAEAAAEAAEEVQAEEETEDDFGQDDLEEDETEDEPDEPDEPETPAGKITGPVCYDEFTVRAVEGEYGRYHFQDINGKQWIDFDDLEGANELSMTVEQWRGLLAELRKAAAILGVEL